MRGAAVAGKTCQQRRRFVADQPAIIVKVYQRSVQFWRLKQTCRCNRAVCTDCRKQDRSIASSAATAVDFMNEQLHGRSHWPKASFGERAVRESRISRRSTMFFISFEKSVAVEMSPPLAVASRLLRKRT